MKKYLSLQDVQLLPVTPTNIQHRRECDVTQTINGMFFRSPLIPATMHSIIGNELLHNLKTSNYFAIQLRESIAKGAVSLSPIAIDSSLDNVENVCELLLAYGHTQNRIVSIQVANGHMSRVGSVINDAKNKFPSIQFWAGTVCTKYGTQYLKDYGADAVFLSIGNGSVCATTPQTGVGCPPFTMIEECSQVDIPIILAAGCRNYGEVCKALAAGCDLVLSGYLFRGCKDSAFPTEYFGEASITGKKQNRKETKFIEGIEIDVPVSNKTSVDVLDEFEEALQSSMSYLNAKNLTEYRNNANFIEV